MNSEMKEFVLVYSIIDKKSGKVLVDCGETFIKAPRIVTAMALHRIELAKSGIDDTYMIIYHDGGEIS